ncbi:UBX domain-containing protein [Ditylenchus destructor]|nr:UBX domain-containing protein [Ditylenchus destructor]
MAHIHTLRSGEPPEIGPAEAFHVNNKWPGQTGFGQALFDAAETNLAARANVVLYKDGIKVGAADVVRYTDRTIHPLLREIALGETPAALQGQQVVVDYEDSNGIWGAGQALGREPAAVDEDAQELDPVEQAQQNVGLDENQPVTRIQIRMPTSELIVGQFNYTHTVENLRTFIRSAHPSIGERPFRLRVLFPSRTLNAPPEMTLDAADLVNVSLTLEFLR